MAFPRKKKRATNSFEMFWVSAVTSKDSSHSPEQTWWWQENLHLRWFSSRLFQLSLPICLHRAGAVLGSNCCLDCDLDQIGEGWYFEFQDVPGNARQRCVRTRSIIPATASSCWTAMSLFERDGMELVAALCSIPPSRCSWAWQAPPLPSLS